MNYSANQNLNEATYEVCIFGAASMQGTKSDVLLELHLFTILQIIKPPLKHVIYYIFLHPGHKDSVTNVSFSHDGSMVATGDMSGIIKVWRLDKMDEIWSFEGSDLEV